MAEANDILISVEQRHALNMVAGEKTVELRRRPVRVAQGCRVWIYSKVPRGHVEAIAIVDEVVTSAPSSIWARYSAQTGISRAEFDSYYDGCEVAYAILLRDVRRLGTTISLEEIRKRFASFQPPQFFRKLAEGSPELTLFNSALA